MNRRQFLGMTGLAVTSGAGYFGRRKNVLIGNKSSTRLDNSIRISNDQDTDYTFSISVTDSDDTVVFSQTTDVQRKSHHKIQSVIADPGTYSIEVTIQDYRRSATVEFLNGTKEMTLLKDREVETSVTLSDEYPSILIELLEDGKFLTSAVES